jgi:heat shock protein HtpX
LRVLEAHGAADRENHARVRANRRRVVALCAAAAFLPALAAGVVVGVLLGPAVGAGAALAAGVVAGALAARTALSVALGVVGGRPVGDDDQPALANLVEGICATMGVARPELRLVDDPVVNSCSLAGRHGKAVIVVTTGLLERLGLIEMEGVVAHELAHVKRLDARVAAVAVATAGTVARLTGDDRPVHLAVGRGREYDADRVAVLAVRYPPGLHDALVRCSSGPVARDGSVFAGRRWAATRWLWIDPMVGAPDRMPIGELDATDVRAAALAEW